MRSATVTRGEHACALYRSDEEHWEITADFLGAGLHRGEQVLCFDDEGSADAVLRRLDEDGLDLRPYRDRGQLLVEPIELPTRSAGPTAAQIAAAIGSRVQDCTAEGFPALRFAFETASVLRATADVDWLLEIDAACASLWATAPVNALCQVDLRLASPDQHTKIRSRHQREVDMPAVHDDGLLRITHSGGSHRLAGEIDLRNREVLRAELHDALAHDEADLHLEVASLRFVDATTLGMLADAVDGLAAGRRIVLERPGPVLRRLLRVCELERLPGLVIEPALAEGEA